MKVASTVLSALLVVGLSGAIAAPANASGPIAQTMKVKTASWEGCSFNTANTGVPTKCFYQHLQWFVLKPWGYTGAIDGALGTGSWKAMQKMLNAGGYNAGTVDGVAGYQTKTALQRLLKRQGLYSGPIDGILGTGTYKGLAMYVLGSMN